MNTLYVGIDVSSKSNVVYLMLPNGDKHSNFSVANSHKGSTQLVKRILSALTSHSLDTVIIGLEATSVYGDNLVYFLREDATLAPFNRKIHVLNPKQVKKFHDAYNDLPKNDYVDSFVIADCLRFGRINKEVYIGDYHYKALQNLTRARYFAVQNLTKEKQRFMTQSEQLQDKILQKDNLEQRLSLWRKANQKIVFTNGCFDLLHLGHVDYLAKAKDLGDRLIVGINSDSSVRRLKGSHRPLQDENSRLHIIAALASVDAVILFDEDTPYELIKKVQPDILVKGADYKPQDIVGYDIVSLKGGEVKTIEFVEGYSTTAIENRILASRK